MTVPRAVIQATTPAMNETTKRALTEKAGLVMNELTSAILKYTTAAAIETRSNGLALHRAFAHLKEVLAPQAEEEIRQYYLDVGVRDASTISDGLRTALLPSLSALGSSLGASYQGGTNPGLTVRWIHEVQAWAQAHAQSIPIRTRVSVEKQRGLDSQASRSPRETAQRVGRSATVGDEGEQTRTVQLFVSHSARDADIVELLVTLLRSALTLPATDIRCTSVDGYRLPGGADTNAQLRREVNDSTVLLGVISTESLSSLYVVFELGARWGTGKTFIPLLAPGTPSSVLGGPLAAINALRLDREGQIHQLLGDLGQHLQRPVESPAVYKRDLDAFLKQAEAKQAEVIAANLRPDQPPEAAAPVPIDDTKEQLTIPIGLFSHYFATEPDGDTSVQPDCRVLVCGTELSNMKELLPILEQVASAKQPLFIVAKAVSGEVLATLITNTQKGVLRTCVVCTGERSDARKIERLVAERTSTRVFHDEAGLALETATLAQLGQARIVEAGANATKIVPRVSG